MTDSEPPGGYETSAASPEPAAPDTDVRWSPPTGPPAPDRPGERNVTAPRLAAALIDIVVLTGLLVIMAATVGTFRVGSSGFDFFVGGWWFLVYLALLLLYYFALETLTGQTVGKLLLGVRVQRTDGSRPSAAAIAGRTVLRLIDWLPLLYLVGFIAMMATGARRQRLGDLAASTAVTRALPSRRWALGFVPLAAVLLAATSVSIYRASSAGGPQTYHAHGVSFTYPAGWQQSVSVPQTSNGGTNQLWTTTVGPGASPDSVTVTAYRLLRPVTAQNIGAVILDVKRLTSQMFRQVKGSVQPGYQKGTMAGMPALLFGGTGTISGTDLQSILVFAFRGTTEYFVNCQNMQAEAAAIGHACVQVVRSFRLDGGQP